MDKKKLNQNKKDISEAFLSLFDTVDHLIMEMKQQSSEEVLNGSIEAAQKLLSEILPYQGFYEKLKEAKMAFDSIGGVSKADIESVKEKIEALDQEQIDIEVEKESQNEEVTTQINFRIPILKALIYLGGSSEDLEVTEFVKKEMKNKLTDKDQEVPKGEDKERWLSNLYFETATMMDEGLLSKGSSNKKWEIAQKGIDYLSKYAK